MPTRQKKRFIAGAICPRCHRQDSLILRVTPRQETVSCVCCGFSQSAGEAQTSTADSRVIGLFTP